MCRILLIFQSLLLGLLTGCSSDDNATGDNGSSEPSQHIVWTPQTPTVGSAVTFSVEGNTDNIRNVLWTFGDTGVESSKANKPIEHTYAATGTYSVHAYVSGYTASLVEITASVTIADTEAAPIISNLYPARMEQVSFALNNLSGVASVTWSFGDESASQRVTDPMTILTHSYSAEGSYSVETLIVYDDGQKQTLTNTLVVEGESLSYSCKHFDKSKVWIMAHRGNYKGGYDLAPNSLSAYRKCVELGYVELIETDAQITKDGVVICLHDNYLKRFTDYSNYANDEGYVANFTYEEIKKYHLKTTDGVVTSDCVPTLEEVLTEFRGKVWFNIDKCSDTEKDVTAMSKIYDVVKKCGCLDRVQFYVGNGGTVNAEWLSKQATPGIITPHANNADQLSSMTAYSPYYIVQTSTNTLAANISWLSTINTKGLSVTNLLDDYNTAFLGGDTSVIDSFMGAGLNIVQCDYAPEVYAYLQKKGKR